jgi:hypothetical protein
MRPQFVTTMILQSLVGTRRMLMDLRRKFHVQGFMGTFVVEDQSLFATFIEPAGQLCRYMFVMEK